MAIALTTATANLPFDNQPLWHNSAPRGLVNAFARDDAKKAWAAWQKHLARRRRPRAPRFLVGKRPPLLWAWPTAWEREGILLHGRGLAQLARELGGDCVRG